MIPNMNTKTIKKLKIPKLRTEKIAYWVFITTENLKFQLLVKIYTIRFPNFNRIQIIFGFGKLCE